MTFERRAADKWRDEIPGARWFKADLHVHTIDDHPGGRAKMPAGLSGDPASPQTLASYARRFLKTLVERGVQVVGLTPHSPRAGTGPETSAVWRIVEEWNSGTDDDGVPFREKVYAIFPGFEPSLKDGKSGLHLLFLFDPEIGRDHYLKAFDLVMGGILPWRAGTLQISGKRADEAFDELKEFRERERPVGADGNRMWGSIVLAPRIDAEKGLLGAQKTQVLQLFDHVAVTGLELGDDRMPDNTLENRPWLRDEIQARRQALFHASDAYRLNEIGRRYSWIKLASPRIEALRQAFIASDSRMRIGFEKGGDGALRPIGDPPDVTSREHPWLREVTVCGGASFFGGQEGGGPRKTRFRLSPGLTCIIGGSMTGKSTLLDGLRLHVGATLPADESIRRQVETRGRDVFAVGSPEVALDCPGQEPTASPFERWPARFFAQNELQRLSQEGAAVEDILSRLIPSEIEGIGKRSAELERLDERLADLAKGLAKLDEVVEDAEQACQRTGAAKKTLATFSKAGVDLLQRASGERRSWEAAANAVRTALGTPVGEAVRSAREFDLPSSDESVPQKDKLDWRKLDLEGRQRRIVNRLEAVTRETEEWIADILDISSKMSEREAAVRIEVEQALAARGYDAGTLKEIQQLTRQASLFPSYKAHRDDTRHRLAADEAAFSSLSEERRTLVEAQRQAFERVAQGVGREFGGRIRVRRIDNAVIQALDGFLRGLRQKGVTQWWKYLDPSERPSPDRLVACLDADSLSEVGMSGAVQKRFRESVTRAKRRELATLRCPDRYALELRMDDGSYRPLNDLSGGQRVSVLLSLLLETEDARPLVIDQPEDELDNRFLSETVLPALKKLRGRRQVIVATHKAEIVVNGDPDLVIQLDATARRGRVACAGSIEEPTVRDAIVRTVDGGEEAFRLRRRKYGF